MLYIHMVMVSVSFCDSYPVKAEAMVKANKTYLAIWFSTGKYETVGSLAVSTLLIGGAIGIGWHSFELMMNVLQVTGVNETASAVVATAVDPISSPSVAPAVQELASISEHHHHGQTLNANAAWFALASIIIKEWLYRASRLISRDDLLIAE